jgi:mersacidin/lichenicidin family type 2 lantibiotic
MSKSNIIRAWKDPAYRNSLSQAERAAMPANPAGAIEISDADLGKVAGGAINQSQVGVCRTQACSVFCTNQYCPTEFFYCITKTIC